MKVHTLCLVLGLVLVILSDYGEAEKRKAKPKTNTKKNQKSKKEPPMEQPRFDPYAGPPENDFIKAFKGMKQEEKEKKKAIKKRDERVQREAKKRIKQMKIREKEERLRLAKEKELRKNQTQSQTRKGATVLSESDAKNLPCNMECPACNRSMVLPCVEYSKFTCRWPY
jgi:hypothetical protein